MGHIISRRYKMKNVGVFLVAVAASVLCLVEATSPRRCSYDAFVQASCNLNFKPITLAGADGAHGHDGKVGPVGKRGHRGAPSKLCSQGKCKLKTLSLKIYTYFEKLKEELRWIEHTFDQVEEIQPSTMTKEELLKVVIKENNRLITEHNKVNTLEKEVKDVKEVLKNGGVKIEKLDKLKKEVTKEIEKSKIKDKKIKELKEKITKINKKVKVTKELKHKVKNLKEKVEDLNKVIKETKDSGKSINKLHKTIKELHEKITKKTKKVEKEIKEYKKEIKEKTKKTTTLKKTVTKLEKKVKSCHEATQEIVKANKLLEKKIHDLQIQCKKNAAKQKKLLTSCQHQYNVLKAKCKTG